MSYAQLKGIDLETEETGGAYLDGSDVIVPIYDLETREVIGTQRIPPFGKKLYSLGLRKSESTGLLIGPETKRLIIAEGWATACAVHKFTSDQALFALDAGHIPHLCKWLKLHFPNRELIVAADNDDAGLNAAMLSSLPWSHPSQLNDWDDVLRAEGAEAAKEQFYRNINPPAGDPPEGQTPIKWLLPLSEMLAQTAPPRWVIKGIFEEGTLGMLFGPSGCGKSFITIDMAMHIATALPSWHGHTIFNPGPVVYLAGEGHYGMRRRLAAWTQRHGKSSEGVELHISQSGCDLDTDDGYAKALAAIEALDHAPRVIFVDTLHRFLSGDENSAGDAKIMIDACGRLQQQFGCSVILVHHTGVGAEAQNRGRGSSAWKGALDFEFSIEKKDDVISLKCRKAKDGPEMEPLHFELQDVSIDGWLDEDGNDVSSAIIAPSDEPKALKGDQKTSKFVQWFVDVWNSSGCALRGDAPYVERSTMKEYLQVTNGFAERTAKNHVNPSRQGDMISWLIEKDMIAPKDKGWIMIDSATALIMKTAAAMKT